MIVDIGPSEEIGLRCNGHPPGAPMRKGEMYTQQKSTKGWFALHFAIK
jgi:hypothetical protein